MQSFLQEAALFIPITTTSRPVSNFEFNSLLTEGYKDEGNPVFSGTTLYTQESMRPERTLVVQLTIPGDLPAFGISYVDTQGDGIKHFYYLSESGYDGSLSLTEYFPAK